jgi:hypothetical protein
MATTTIMERTAPSKGRRMLLTGIAGLLVGGICGVLVSWTIQHRTQSVGIVAAVPAFPAVGPEVFSPEAVRALRAARVSFSPEAARALNGYAPTVTLEAFSPEAARALSSHAWGVTLEAFSPEAAKALGRYAPMPNGEVFSPEAVRARNG